MSKVTQHLKAIGDGDSGAAEGLIPLIYEELKAVARRQLAQEGAGHSLQTTDLVHEAYLRLLGTAATPKWDGRGHFFAAAAEAMRRLLVDRARRRLRLKRGGDRERGAVEPEEIVAPQPIEDLLALDEALEKLAVIDKAAAEVVKLRYFAGLTLLQSAEAMAVSPRTADRLWGYARAWLHRELRPI